MKLSDISIPALHQTDEVASLYALLNDTQTDYPHDKSIVDLFADMVKRHGGKTAVKMENTSLTYRELDLRSNQVANWLLSCGVKKETVVAIYLDRSVEMIVSVMGILKAGGAYVPLNTDYPFDRIRFILNESKALVLISEMKYLRESNHLQLCTPSLDSVLCMDSHDFDSETERSESWKDVEEDRAAEAKDGRKLFDARTLETYSTEPCGVTVSPDQLSDIIFTSGSTGKPKGVMIEHHAIIRTVRNTNYFDIGPSDVMMQSCEFSFDPACIEIFGALLNGATLCMVSKKKLFNTPALAAYMTSQGVTMTVFVTSLFHLHAEANSRLLTGLRLLLVGGEVMNTVLAEKVRAACPLLRIVNCYGPTENAMITTTFDVDGHSDTIPIGKPISNTGVYILNKKLQLQPVGITGELYTYGEGLARGYLNNDALTAERFVDDPFRPGEKMYRTGDLARLRYDHEVEFLGRADDQVKVRGHRVELHEIEQVLLQIPQVSQAVISFAKNTLSGYVTLTEDMDVDVMKQMLSVHLPFYMIPQHIIKLEQFPLSVNGKIDRKALPDPESILKSGEDAYVAPTNTMEARLAEIFQQTLGLQKVSIRDDFFALGGHSLLATKVLTLVHKELNAKLRLEDFFENPRIDRLAKVLELLEKDVHQEIAVLPQQEFYEMSYAQRRMWMTDKIDDLKLAYNMTNAYLFEGEINVLAFESALLALINRHESLRTIFVVSDGQPYQKILGIMPVPLSVIDLREQPNREESARKLVAKEAAISFDLSAGPLMRFMLIRLEDNKHVFFQKLHHIISDGWSMELLVSEMYTLYNGYLKGTEAGLPPLRIQYKEFAAWQNGLLNGGNLSSLKTYWNERFAEKPAPLALPLDFSRPAVKQSDAEKLFFKLDTVTAQKVEDIGSKVGATMYMTMLSLIGMLLAKLTRQYDFVMGSPVSGRNEASLHNQIGLYLNTLAMRLKVDPARSFSEHLEEVRKDTLAAFDHQEYPIDLLMEDMKLTRDASRSPLFDIGFTWQNVEETSTQDVEGLKVYDFPTGQQKIKTDLWFHAWNNEEGIHISITYDKALFKKETALSFIDDFKLITEAMLNNANRPVGSVLDTITADQAEKKRNEKKKASLESFLKTRKTAVSITPQSLVSTSVLNPVMGFPMITIPAISGVLLNEWVKNNKEAITTQLRSTGAVLFRGFGISSVDAFEQLSVLLGESQMKYMDQSSPRSLVGEKVYTSTDYPSDQEINMHNELSYSQDWPLRILFFCLKQPASGGETPIADSRKVLAHISEKTRARFAEKGILYVRNLVDGLGLSWKSVYQTDKKEDVEAYCRKNGVGFEWLGDHHLRISWKKPAIVQHPFTGEEVWFNHGFFFNARNLPEEVRMGIEDPAHYPSDTFYGDGTPIEEEVIAELRRAFDAAKVLFPWQKGDVLLLDNMLMSHGRSSFSGERKVLVSMNTPFSAITAK